MFLIFLFATACIFGSVFVRDISSSGVLSRFLDYTISFENRFYDYRMRNALNPKLKINDVVLVKIDDSSLQKLGVWPIPRTIHAGMIDKLRDFGAKVVALDILFPEKSPMVGDQSPDTVFAESIKNFQTAGGRVFVAYTLASYPDEALPEAPVEMLNDAVLTRNVPEVDFIAQKISRFTFPIQEIVETEVGLGSITSAEDPDGIFRQYQLAVNVDTIYYGSLALNSYEALTGKKNTIKISADGSGELEINGKKMEISRNGETKIRYIGGEEQFANVSLHELLNTPSDDIRMKDLFNGKIVFVGSTALGAHDLRPSPIDAKMPGVFSHMNMAYMLMNQYFFQSSNESLKYSLIILCIGMMIFLFAQRFESPVIDATVVAALITLSFYADSKYFLPMGYEIKLFYCFFCFIACYSWNTFLRFSEANKEKKQIRGTFARYVSPTIVDEMLKDPENIQVGGTKKDITCLFSDVRDFTKISENLSAVELAHSLNFYMGKMTDIVFETRGTLDKYIGDAIVAIWGAPLDIGNHAQHAVEGAIKMMELLPSINEEFRKLGRPEFNVGIGLNSGECSVGNMGSDRIFSYTALGDNMNLGARLESLCKYYGAQIIISQMTLDRLDVTNIKVRPLDKVIVKGKTQAVPIYEVLHKHHWMSKDPEYLKFFLSAHKFYQEKKFTEARDIFGLLVTGNDFDKPSKRFYELCQKFIDHPELVTEDFEVTKMTEK